MTSGSREEQSGWMSLRCLAISKFILRGASCVCVSRSATFIDLHKNNFIHCSSWWSYWRFRATFTYLLIHLPANCGQVKTEILRVPFAKLLIRAEFGPFFQSGESQRAIYAYHIPHTASRISWIPSSAVEDLQQKLKRHRIDSDTGIPLIISSII